MKDEANNTVLVKHYQNLRKITLEQLQAIKKGDLEAVKAKTNQKQFIIESIKTHQVEIANLPQQVTETLQPLMEEILAMEEKGQMLLGEQSNIVRNQLVAAKKGMALQQAYEAPVSAGMVVNRYK